ncbi:MAG: hypothetical protein KDA81_18890, partial [Planctomycetaceae bacterium]|nr:hypothetical protein [Planctomycetaceae bacterium]
APHENSARVALTIRPLAISVLCCTVMLQANSRADADTPGFARLDNSVDDATDTNMPAVANDELPNVHHPAFVLPPTQAQNTGPKMPDIGAAIAQSPAPLPKNLNAQFSETDFHKSGQFDFNHFPPDFLSGAYIRNGPLVTKFGGYVKADLIHDFDPIDSTDTFDPTTIPVGAPHRTNTRFHTRQSRLNMDNRWTVPGEEPIRVMVEGDFFGDNSTFRLRHAYGESGHWLIGQTWSTFAHRAALPNTLDSVGDVASIGRRQTQLRWTHHLIDDRLLIGAALENSQVRVDDVFLAVGTPRSELPDAVLRLRLVSESSQFQIAGLARRLGFQPNGQDVRTFTGRGMNATGLIDITDDDRVYGGILWGTGIGDYRDLPDLAPVSSTEGKALQSLAWYVGLKHQWNKAWSSNFTYSAADVQHTAFQPVDSLARNRYLAANLIWKPREHGFIGIEYLRGFRENGDGNGDSANRVMMSVGFILP